MHDVDDPRNGTELPFRITIEKGNFVVPKTHPANIFYADNTLLYFEAESPDDPESQYASLLACSRGLPGCEHRQIYLLTRAMRALITNLNEELANETKNGRSLRHRVATEEQYKEFVSDMQSLLICLAFAHTGLEAFLSTVDSECLPEVKRWKKQGGA